MKTLTVKEFSKEVQSFVNTTKRGCKVYVVVGGVKYPIKKEDIDAYGNNTLVIEVGR